MPQDAWSPNRERQYEHVKDSELEEGRSKEEAEEIAARTVNKHRAEAGETRASGASAKRGGTGTGTGRRARPRG
jgi:hypothetical protein